MKMTYDTVHSTVDTTLVGHPIILEHGDSGGHEFTFDGPLDADLLPWVLARREQLCDLHYFFFQDDPESDEVWFATDDDDLAVLTKLTWGGE